MITPNTYFNGNVQSLGFTDTHGRATVGVMEPGTYHFTTAGAETMTVVSGCLRVQLPRETKLTDYPAGSSFEVPMDSRFDLRVDETSTYLCRFH